MLESFIQNRVEQARKIFLDIDTNQINKIMDTAKLIYNTFESGKKVAFVGNGGSAAEAMHLAAEFTGKCVLDHKPLDSICLNESQSAITAIANDYGTEFIFSRQVQAHLSKGDVLIAMSTSGKSKNILAAVNEANKLEVKTILWMGNFESNLDGIEIWKVQSKSTPRIQEMHLFWGHTIAECVEEIMANSKN